VNIKIKSLKIDTLSENSIKKSYLYKDLELDLTSAIYFNKQLNKNETLKDVSAIYDVEAVKNSVATAFLTAPGDKILNPTYGVDLRQFLFEPVDDFTLDIIKDHIEVNLPRSEPRIEVVDVEVTGDEDENTININLQINVPSLGITGLSIKSQLNSTGYSTL
jgi:phage baseplate assembly protein W